MDPRAEPGVGEAHAHGGAESPSPSLCSSSFEWPSTTPPARGLPPALKRLASCVVLPHTHAPCCRRLHSTPGCSQRSLTLALPPPARTTTPARTHHVHLVDAPRQAVCGSGGPRRRGEPRATIPFELARTGINDPISTAGSRPPLSGSPPASPHLTDRPRAVAGFAALSGCSQRSLTLALPPPAPTTKPGHTRCTTVRVLCNRCVVSLAA